MLLGLIWSTSDSHLYMLNFCLSPGVLPNITQVLLPVWHPEVSTFLLLSLVVSSARPPLTSFICTEWGTEWPCSTLLLSWRTWREARGSASAAWPAARAPAFACSGAFLWGRVKVILTPGWAFQCFPCLSLQLSSMVWGVLQTSQQLGRLPRQRTGEPASPVWFPTF